MRTVSSFFSYCASRMSENTNSKYWIGGSIGGLTLASVSAIVMWVAEKKIPNGKTIGRDVLLGIILFFILLQILPESTTMLLSTITSFITFSNIKMMEAVGTVSDTIPSLDEMEVRVGVPKF